MESSHGYSTSFSTLVRSFQVTPGKFALASSSFHVVSASATRPLHAYCHVPPIVNASFASTIVTSMSAMGGFDSARAHPRPPKPAPMTTTFIATG